MLFSGKQIGRRCSPAAVLQSNAARFATAWAKVSCHGMVFSSDLGNRASHHYLSDNAKKRSARPQLQRGVASLAVASIVASTASTTPCPTASNSELHADELPVIDVPVLIVGSGVTGAALSAFLTHFDVPHLLVDKAESRDALFNQRPRKDYLVLLRGMEMMRQLQHEDIELISSSPPLPQWRSTSIGKSICSKAWWGNVLGHRDEFAALRSSARTHSSNGALAEKNFSVPDWYTDPHSPSTVARVSTKKLLSSFLNYIDNNSFSSVATVKSDIFDTPTCDISDLFQDMLESSVRPEIQRRTLRVRGPSSEEINERHHNLQGKAYQIYGCEWAGGFPGKLGVTSYLKDVKTQNRFVTCNSGLVIGTDGKHSTVRTSLLETEGCRMENLLGASPRDFQVIEFESAQLGDLLNDEGGRLRHISVTSKAAAILEAQNLSEGHFACHVLSFAAHRRGSFSEKQCRKIVEAAAGVALTDIRISALYCTGGPVQILTRLRDATTGRVLVAGDAARTYPGFESASVTGALADVQNLAWKLGYIYHNRRHLYADNAMLTGSPIDPQSSRILESYAAERFYSAHFELNQWTERLEKFLHWLWVGRVNLELQDMVSITVAVIHKALQKATGLRLSSVRWLLDAMHNGFYTLQLKKAAVLQHLYPVWLSRQYWSTEMLKKPDALPGAIPWGLDLCVAYRNSPLNPQVKNSIPYIRGPRDSGRYNPATFNGCRIPHTFVVAEHPKKKFLLSTVDFPLMDPLALKFCLVVWDPLAIDIILTEMERLFFEAEQDDEHDESEINRAQRYLQLMHPISSHFQHQDATRLREMLKKFVVVLWRCPDAKTSWQIKQTHEAVNERAENSVNSPRTSELLATPNPSQLTVQERRLGDYCAETDVVETMRVSSLAGHVGALQAVEQFSFIDPYPWKLPPAERACLGKANLPTEKTTESRVELDIRSVWSDNLSLESYKHALRIRGTLRDAAAVIRPDSHIATLCHSLKDPALLNLFAAELWKLPIA